MTRPLVAFFALALVACGSVTEPTLRDCTFSQRTAQAIPANSATLLRFDAAVCASAAAGDRMRLPEGTWIVVAQITWSPSPEGARGALLLEDTRDSTGVSVAWSSSLAMPTHTTSQQMTAIVVSDGTAEVYVSAAQTSGATLSTWALGIDGQTSATYIHAARID